MIPIIDLLVKNYIEDGMMRLRKEPDRIRRYFSYANKKTIEDMVRLVTQFKIHILSGYPRQPTELPCIIITIAGEDEVPHGIGDGVDQAYPEWERGEKNYLHWTGEDNSKYVRENAQMRAQIRVEAWSDNAVTTSFLYALIKYCLFSAKWDMVNNEIILPTVSGGDLEPVPDYMTIFVYRRAVMLNFEYTLGYHVGGLIIGKEEGHFELGTTIDDLDIKMKGYREEEVSDGEE